MTNRPSTLASSIPLRTAAAFLLSLSLSWAALAYTQSASGIAAIWPANAAVLVLVLKTNPRAWPLLLAAALGGNLMANLAAQQSMPLGVFLSLGNTLEITLAAWLIQRGGARRLLRRSGLIRLAVASVAASLASTLWAGAVLFAVGQTLAPQGALLWLSADLLGLLVFAPAILAMVEGGLSDVFQPGRRREALAWLAILVLSTVAVFYQTAFPLLFIPPAVLVLKTLRLGAAGAAAGVLVVAAIAIGLSVAGRGPLALVDASIETRILVLQLFLGALTAISLAVGTSVSERAALIGRLTLSRGKVRDRLAVERRLLVQSRLAEGLSQAGYWTFETETQELFWSPEMYRIHGRDPQTFIPTISSISPVYDGVDVRGRLQAWLDGRVKESSIDFTLVRPDGERRDVRSIGSAERGPDGRVTRLFGVLKDLTDERRLVAQTVEAERRYRLLAESSIDVIAIYDLDGVFTYLSPSIRDLLGFEPDELIGTKTYDLIVEEDRAGVARAFEKGRRSKASFSVEYRARTKQGDIRWLEAHPRFVADGPGGAVVVADSVRDITRRREREAALAEALETAQAAVRARTNFLANMSHEIRTPLTGVLGYAELLSRGAKDKSQKQYVDRILTAGQGLSVLIDDILDLSRIEAGKTEIASQPYDLREVVAEVLALTEMGARKPLRFSSRVSDDIGQRVTGDRARVRQVLLNLLGNAAKFTEQGSVELHADLDDGQILIRITDTGIGMTPDTVARVFDSFTQGDDAVSRRYGGSGLGLTISRSLARLMGGDIRLESDLGTGTTAVLNLPHEAARPSNTALPRAPKKNPSASLSVLVVDDVEMNRELLELMVGNEGHRVTLAESGAAAIARIEGGEAFDVVLMDVQMPDMDGLETTRRLRSQGITTPIIALTAGVLPDQVSACLAAGMNRHLSKPVTPAELAAALTDASKPVPTSEAQTLEDDPALRFQRRYRSELGQIASEFDSLLVDGGQQAADAARRLAHSVAGTAGLLGLSSLSAVARDTETALRSLDDEAALPAIVQPLIDALKAERNL